MITFLERLFIKKRDDVSAPAIRQAYGVLCGAVGIFLNLLLFLGKFLAGLFTNSIAITADAFNNLSDAGSSIVTLIGFKLAGQKPDPGHPFGHGRIEYLSGLLVSFTILIMAFELVKTSFEKILHPEEVLFSTLSIIILIISIGIKLYMTFYNKRIGKKINSTAMNATAIDSLSDSLATTMVLITSILSHFTGINLDGYCGILVGLFIFYAGFKAAKETLDPLLGQAPDEEFVQAIEELVMSHKEIVGVHDLIVHDYGPGRLMISLHAEVPASGNVLALHDMIDLIEHELRSTLHCDAVIHMDPVVTDDEETLEVKRVIHEILASIDDCISMHDFRMIPGPTHTNLIYDIVVPFGYRINDDELKKEICQQTLEYNCTYFSVIEIDKAYINHHR